MSRRRKKCRRGRFTCNHCNSWVSTAEDIGTKNRNHCPTCLWSKHVDLNRPGDRKSSCGAPMKPIGITLKHEGYDKYGMRRRGELMIVHKCTNDSCNRISINRIAADDNAGTLLNIFEESQQLDEGLRKECEGQGISLLTDEEEINRQLFGNVR